jgi:hypothetical protein
MSARSGPRGIGSTQPGPTVEHGRQCEPAALRSADRWRCRTLSIPRDAGLFRLHTRTVRFVDSIRERSGFVLVDSPSLGNADVSLLPLMDAVLFVVDCRRIHSRRLVVARRQLDRVNADLLGVVFNRANASVIRPEPSFLAAAGSAPQ